jgi:hypothetical protein
MQGKIRFLRIISLVMLMVYIQIVIFPIGSYAQISGCQYNSDAPSLNNARKNFNSFNYKCAETELNDLFKNTSLNPEEKSNAHILMAAVYYAILKDSSEKRNAVIDQFKAAFRANRNWKGELDIISPEFSGMMKEAQSQVEREKGKLDKPRITQAKDTTSAVAPKTPAKVNSKPWYKQWWAIGLGVGVVAGAVIILSGGGGETTAIDTLPPFPPPPVGK